MSARVRSDIELGMRPLDDTARDGGCWLVCDADRFAVARFTSEGWVFPMSGRPIEFEPTRYHFPGGTGG